MERGGETVREDTRRFVDSVTADWQYSWSPIVVEGDGWAAVCGDEIDGERIEPAPFPFVTTGRTPSDKRIAELLDEAFSSRVSKTYYDTEPLL